MIHHRIRGGSYWYSYTESNSISRYYFASYYDNEVIGFRIAFS